MTLSRKMIKLCLIYGFWLENKTGDLVYFNRKYQPIWRLSYQTGTISQANPNEWISFNPGREHFFYSDSTAPWVNAHYRRKALKHLRKLGIKPGQNPIAYILSRGQA